MDNFYLERGFWVPIGELPPTLLDAFIASEDRRFREHGGIDDRGIVRALGSNLRAGRKVQGGSTLTQQLVKNLLVGSERSYVRKLKEAVLAWRLEREWTRDDILELYVNCVFLGSGNHGVEAAARDYFGVSARDLDPGQGALLAGLVPSPTHYSPRRAPKEARRRRRVVLGLLVAEGRLEPTEAASYDQDPVLVPRDASDPRGRASCITVARREIRDRFGDEAAASAGLVVHTALVPAIQEASERAVLEALDALGARQGRQGPTRNLPPEARAEFLRLAGRLPRDEQSGRPLPPNEGDCFEALVPEGVDLDELAAGPYAFALAAASRDEAVRVEPGRPPVPVHRALRAGDIVPVCAKGRGVVLDPRPWAEGAAVVIEHATGRVVALVGGRDVRLGGFVRATQGQRQPGSAFKPIVYAAALEAGQSQLDPVPTRSVSLSAGGGKRWSPRDPHAGERLSMRRALAVSSNNAAVRTLLRLGAGEVADLAGALGIESPLGRHATLALGASEVSPLEMTRACAALARLGVPAEAVFIDHVTDVDGREVGRAGQPLRLDGASPWGCVEPGAAGACCGCPRWTTRPWRTSPARRGGVTRTRSPSFAARSQVADDEALASGRARGGPMETRGVMPDRAS